MDLFFYSYQEVQKSDIFWVQKKSKIECGPLTPFILKYMLCGPIKRGELSFLWPYLLSGPIYEQKPVFWEKISQQFRWHILTNLIASMCCQVTYAAPVVIGPRIYGWKVPKWAAKHHANPPLANWVQFIAMSNFWEFFFQKCVVREVINHKTVSWGSIFVAWSQYEQ